MNTAGALILSIFVAIAATSAFGQKQLSEDARHKSLVWSLNAPLIGYSSHVRKIESFVSNFGWFARGLLRAGFA